MGDRVIEIYNFDYLSFQSLLANTVGTTDTEKYALCFSLTRLSEKELEQENEEIEDFYQMQLRANQEDVYFTFPFSSPFASPH